LRRAIELDNSYIEDAKTEEDFDNIRNSKAYNELIKK